MGKDIIDMEAGTNFLIWDTELLDTVTDMKTLVNE